MPPLLRIAISCGELSGDEHAAKVVGMLRERCSLLEIQGMGGRHLRNAGVTTVIDSEKSASVMGFGDVAKSIFKIRKAFSTLAELLKTWKPDLLVVVDYPDFNLRLAKKAHSLGIPVLYFIPPKVWAWRENRVHALKRYTNHLAVIFPHEVEFYRSRGLSEVTFVGHPFVDASTLKIPSDEERARLRESFSIPPNAPMLALLPGSRPGEIRRHLDRSLQAVELLLKRFPNLKTVIPIAPSLGADALSPDHQRNSSVLFTHENSLDVMKAADVGLLKSGTSNLQAAFLGLPFGMFYNASPLSEWIVRHFVHVKEFSPVNIIHPGTVKELVQEQSSPEALACYIGSLLESAEKRMEIKGSLLSLAGELRYRGEDIELRDCSSGYERVAALIERVAAR